MRGRSWLRNIGSESMDKPVCPHGDDGGGVYSTGDPYGIRESLGLREYDGKRLCWDCWEKKGSEWSRAVQKETEAAVKEKGWCGFLEAWVGYCKIKGRCEKHGGQKCWECGRMATRNCAHAGQLVCG